MAGSTPAIIRMIINLIHGLAVITDAVRFPIIAVRYTVSVSPPVTALTTGPGIGAELIAACIMVVHVLHRIASTATLRASGMIMVFIFDGSWNLIHADHDLLVNAQDRIIISRDGREIYNEKRSRLRQIWGETTYRMQALRDNPACAREEYEDKGLDGDNGLFASLTFDVNEDVAAPYILKGAAPRVAILREQGVNSQGEMAAAFNKAGFACIDVHMSDILSGRVSLKDFKGFAACGGFSYGDVLGAGEGWAKSVLFNERARGEFESFFNREDTFALGVCNGCQMLSTLKDLIPGADLWPRFVTNRSERFEARFVEVAIEKSPSIFFDGMEGSMMPIVVSHGEGRAEFAGDAQLEALEKQGLVAVRYVDHQGKVTERYPLNPNGSPRGITSVTTPDGRFTILMPHPERVQRAVCNSWHPAEWREDSPWARIFRNARKFVG